MFSSKMHMVEVVKLNFNDCQCEIKDGGISYLVSI